MKKVSKKHKKCQRKTILAIFIIVITLTLIFISYNHEVYSISSRIDKVNNTVFPNKNYEVRGWIRIQGTSIDYPVIGSEKKSSYPVYEKHYAWTRNSDNKFHNNITVVGHNIFNLSAMPKLKSKRFDKMEELMSFVYYDFAKKNQYVQLTIDGKDYIYKIFSVDFISGSDATFLPIQDELSKKDINNYLDILKNNSIYQYNVDVGEEDNFITISTCTRMFSRDANFYVVGRLLHKGERIKRYRVKKSDEYKKLEKIWKENKIGDRDEV